MKHGRKSWQKHFGTRSHTKALVRNLLSYLVIHERIITTEAKAKVLKYYADKVINLAKQGTPEARSKAEAFLYQKALTLQKTTGLLAARYAQRPGGYTRIFKYGFRAHGDKAPLCIVEFVDSPRDIIYHLARKHLVEMKDKVKEAADKVVAGAGTAAERRQLRGKEQSYGKWVKRMAAALASWPLAREAEAAWRLRAAADAKVGKQKRLELLQMKLKVYQRLGGTVTSQDRKLIRSRGFDLADSGEVVPLQEEAGSTDALGRVFEAPPIPVIESRVEEIARVTGKSRKLSRFLNSSFMRERFELKREELEKQAA